MGFVRSVYRGVCWEHSMWTFVRRCQDTMNENENRNKQVTATSFREVFISFSTLCYVNIDWCSPDALSLLFSHDAVRTLLQLTLSNLRRWYLCREQYLVYKVYLHIVHSLRML